MYCRWAETAKSLFSKMITTMSEAAEYNNYQKKMHEANVSARKDSQISDVALKCHALQWTNVCMMHLHHHDDAR